MFVNIILNPGIFYPIELLYFYKYNTLHVYTFSFVHRNPKFPAESGPTPTSADELTKALLSATRLQICQKGQVASCILKVTEIHPITGANEGL